MGTITETTMSVDDVAEFFDATPPPEAIEELEARMQEFINTHNANGTPIVIITSGGTRVPLERNAVRFLDNFSTGSRGSLSAEHFLRNGYAVLFVHRAGSLLPFTGRHQDVVKNLFDLLSVPECVEDSEAQEKPECEAGAEPEEDCANQCESLILGAPGLASTLSAYQEAKLGDLLMCAEFETLGDYLYLLRSASLASRSAGRNACLYLAAAVSDFYIADKDMPEHKMQSSEGPPSITLTSTPKMLGCVRREWAPEAFVVSFKLETDEKILLKKASGAIDKYGVDLVVANILETRKEEVVFVTSAGSDKIVRPEDATEEIESYFISQLATKHQEFISDSSNPVLDKYGSG